jgi:hypothetical protein
MLCGRLLNNMMRKFKKWSLWEPNKSDTPCREHAQLLNVKASGTYCNHCASKGWSYRNSFNGMSYIQVFVVSTEVQVFSADLCHTQFGQSVGERPPLQRAPEVQTTTTDREQGECILNVTGKLKEPFALQHLAVSVCCNKQSRAGWVRHTAYKQITLIYWRLRRTHRPIITPITETRSSGKN